MTTPDRQQPITDPRAWLLAVTLDAMVPLQLAALPADYHLNPARRAADVELINSSADMTLHLDQVNNREDKTRGRAALGALSRAIASLAQQPGGITVLGRHWCTADCDCPRAHTQDRAVHTSRCGCEASP